MEPLSKASVVRQIQEYLAQELSSLVEKAGGSESFEGADADRATELKRLLLMYRFLPVRDYGAEDVVCPGALVELEMMSGPRAHYFVAPSGGGLVTRVDGFPVQVITANSPLGEAVLGKRIGETASVEIRGQSRQYRVVRIA